MSGRRKAAETTAAVVYLRVSTEDQARSGLGRDAQEAACLAFCARQGWTVLPPPVGPLNPEGKRQSYADEGLSGKLPVRERPALEAAVAAAVPGVAFVVYSLSRAFRTQRECLLQVEDERGNPVLPLVSATEPFDLTTAFGRAALGMLATFARLEADLASDRTKAALAAAKASGTKLGAPGMLERVIDGERVIDPARVAVARQIQELRAEGKSLAAIADDLNARGVPTAKPGARWHKRTVAVAADLDLPEMMP
jgi:DNA invertase Pin-like site-specific DNA recombinase